MVNPLPYNHTTDGDTPLSNPFHPRLNAGAANPTAARQASSIAQSTPLALAALSGIAWIVVLVTAGTHLLGWTPIVGLSEVRFLTAVLVVFLTLRGLVSYAITTFFAVRAEAVIPRS